jgi:hypothetical protein
MGGRTLKRSTIIIIVVIIIVVMVAILVFPTCRLTRRFAPVWGFRFFCLQEQGRLDPTSPSKNTQSINKNEMWQAIIASSSTTIPE